jgi:hypothetical protein
MMRNSLTRALCALTTWCLLVPALSFAQTNPGTPVEAKAAVQAAPAETPAPAVRSQSLPAAAPALSSERQPAFRLVTQCSSFVCGGNYRTNCTEVCGDFAVCFLPPHQGQSPAIGHCILE